MRLIPAVFIAIVFTSGAEADVVFFDGAFAPGDYTLTTITEGSGGTVTASQSPTGGNPGAYRSITNHVNNPTGGFPSLIAGYHLNNTFVYHPSSDSPIGSIDFSYDARTQSTAFQVGIGLVVEQNGGYFWAGYEFTQTGSWVGRGLSNLTLADFHAWPNLPPSGLDFSPSGAPLRFGLLVANSADANLSGYTMIGGIDNLRVAVHSSVVPEPGGLVSAALGLLVMAASAARSAVAEFRRDRDG